MTIAYNDIVEEYLRENGYDIPLTSNTKNQENDNIVQLEHATIGSIANALQALYELPLASYKNQNEKALFSDPKAYLSVLVERVVAAKNHWLNNDTSENKLQAGNSETEPYTTIKYTEEEAAQIADFFDRILDNNNLSQNIQTSVGLLFQAAKETQERLMNVEASVYGFDSKTLPGGRSDFNEDPTKIAESLKNITTSSPLLLGLNRIVKALCFEIFNTPEFDKILAEFDTTNPNSEGESPVSILSRLDIIDKNIEESRNNVKMFFEWYMLNHFNKYANRLTLNAEDEADWTTQLPSLGDYDELSEYNEVPRTEFVAPEVDTIQVPKLITEGPNAGFFEKNEDGSMKLTEKRVFWLDDKVARLEAKLRKIVTDLYGVDSPLEKVPNRIEVINKNIETLAKALFWEDDIENKDYENGLLDHFDSKFGDEHLEPITWQITDELYNWLVNQKIVGSLKAKYNNGSQTTTAADGVVRFKNEKPTSKVTSGDTRFGDGYTPIDLIIDYIGDSAYFNSLFKAGTYNGLSTTQLAGLNPTSKLSIEDADVYDNVLLKELSYKVWNNGWVDVDSDDIKISNSTSLIAYISRKEKTLESRMVSVESFADTLTRALSEYAGSGTIFATSASKIFRFEEYENNSFEALVDEVAKLSWFNENTHLPNPVLAAIHTNNELFEAITSHMYALDSMCFKVVVGENTTEAEQIFATAKSQLDEFNNGVPEANRAALDAISLYKTSEGKSIILAYGNNLNSNVTLPVFNDYIVVYNDLQASTGIKSTKPTLAQVTDLFTGENPIEVITNENFIRKTYETMAIDTQSYEPRDVLFDEKINKVVEFAANIYNSIIGAINNPGGFGERLAAIENEIGGETESVAETVQKTDSRVDELENSLQTLQRDHEELIEKYNALVNKLLGDENNEGADYLKQ